MPTLLRLCLVIMVGVGGFSGVVAARTCPPNSNSVTCPPDVKAAYEEAYAVQRACQLLAAKCSTNQHRPPDNGQVSSASGSGGATQDSMSATAAAGDDGAGPAAVRNVGEMHGLGRAASKNPDQQCNQQFDVPENEQPLGWTCIRENDWVKQEQTKCPYDPCGN